MSALLPAEGLLPEVGNFAVDVEVLSLKVVEFAGQLKHFGAKRSADFKLQFFGIFVDLTNVVGGLIGVFANGDFDEFGSAGFEYAAEGELCGGWGGKRQGKAGRARSRLRCGNSG